MMKSARQTKALGLRAQVRLAWRLGLIACLAGFVAAVAAVVLEAGPLGRFSDLLALASMGLIAFGFLGGFGLGFFRPMMAHGFHGIHGALREVILRSAALRWWYWVDQMGRNRDDG